MKHTLEFEDFRKLKFTTMESKYEIAKKFNGPKQERVFKNESPDFNKEVLLQVAFDNISNESLILSNEMNDSMVQS